jgi:hypothetical protein
VRFFLDFYLREYDRDQAGVPAAPILEVKLFDVWNGRMVHLRVRIVPNSWPKRGITGQTGERVPQMDAVKIGVACTLNVDEPQHKGTHAIRTKW